MSEKTVLIQYIGNKDRKFDPVFRRSGRFWPHKNAVLEIPESEALAYTRLDRVFRRVAEVELSEAPQHQTPEPGADERYHKVMDVIAKMDPSYGDHYTPGGKPKIAAVRQLTGIEDLSARELNEYLERAEAE